MNFQKRPGDQETSLSQSQLRFLLGFTDKSSYMGVGGWVGVFRGVEKFLPGARPPHSRSEELKLSQDGVLDGLGILGGDPVAVVV